MYADYIITSFHGYRTCHDAMAVSGSEVVFLLFIQPDARWILNDDDFIEVEGGGKFLVRFAPNPGKTPI